MSKSTPKSMRKLCLECGYVLDGLPSGICSECGQVFNVENPQTYRWESPPPKKMLHVLPIYFVAQFVSLAFYSHGNPYILAINVVAFMSLATVILCFTPLRNLPYSLHVLIAVGLRMIIYPVFVLLIGVLVANI